MQIKNDSGVRMEALYFGDIPAFDACIEKNFGVESKKRMYAGLSNPVDMAFTYYPSVNEYGGRRSLQVTIQNFQRIPR